ncbi:MAG: YHS domain-containing protein [Planctomycetes bacterium]|nr:YHS domain-containing protein [Planctomycetota bacterium]
MDRLKLLFPYIMLGVICAIIALSNLKQGGRGTLEHSPSSICAPCGMTIDNDQAITATIDGERTYYCSQHCRDNMTASVEQRSENSTNQHLVDVVCNMEVNSAWGIQAEFEGTEYFFCTKRCREQFKADPATFLSETCMVCNEAIDEASAYPATYLGKTYRLCSVAHRAEFKFDPAACFMHSMWGIPTWLYYASIALVLIVSFGVFDWMSRLQSAPKATRTVANTENQARSRFIGRDTIAGDGERIVEIGQSGAGAVAIALPTWSPSALADAPSQSGCSSCASCHDRFDLLSVGWIRACLGSRGFRFTLQLFVSVLFLLIIAAGLFGNQNPALNIAPILTWTVWWGLLIVLIMFAGKAWCYVCPWDAIAGWTERVSFWKKSDDGLTLGWKWPRVVRNISIATIMFVGLTWVELGFGVTMKPRVTAYLAIGMLLMAVMSALLFDRKSFCRYGCLVGRVSGLYALFASTEVRSKSAEVCTSCKTKECITGSDTAYGCPTFLYPGKLASNTYCIQCMECIQACPHDNLAVNLRPWGSDLANEGKPRSDEAYLALLMLAITGFHGLTMTPAWRQLIDAIRSSAGVGRVIGFSAGMTLLMLAPIAIYAVLVGISLRLGKAHAREALTYRDYFIRYAYALLPIALFYHIAHNAEHLLMEGPKVMAMISDPFGWGWNVFGTAQWTIPPLISLDKLWLIQVLLVLVGHVYSLWVAQQTSMRLFGTARATFRSQLPMLAGMIAFSVFSLWLLKQPMEMRTSAM